MSDDTPFSQGFAAGLFGLDPRDCPFDKLTAEWTKWQQGHGLAAEYMLYRDGQTITAKPKGATE